MLSKKWALFALIVFVGSIVLTACGEKEVEVTRVVEKKETVIQTVIEEKIETIAKRVYGAESVIYESVARRKIRRYRKLGFQHLPICMAKTQYSLSHDPALKGRPTGYELPILDVRLSAGAGFLYPLCGEIMTMPGLPSSPAATRIDIDEDGQVTGLF